MEKAGDSFYFFFLYLPAVILVLRTDLPIRQLGPNASLALALLIGLAVLPFSHPRVLFLQQNRQRCVGWTEDVDLSSRPVVVVDPVRAAVYPRLGDVDRRGVCNRFTLPRF